jgi:hypothetical protein
VRRANRIEVGVVYTALGLRRALAGFDPSGLPQTATGAIRSVVRDDGGSLSAAH